LDFSADLVASLSKSAKVCPHLHIPIQSGDDEILKKMNRNYDRSLLSDLIQELHQRIPRLSIGADVIVGFPGETEGSFRCTYALIESLPFSYLHIFPFSKRKGTPASQFPQRVDEAVIKKRAEEMRELGKQKRQAFYRQFLHQELNVLLEDRREKESGRWKGFSRNYIPVLLPYESGSEGEPNWINQEWTMRVIGIEENSVIGRVVEK
jgi:threonylcarbamoyladenosine tRNA methylthiotransferase MtaB